MAFPHQTQAGVLLHLSSLPGPFGIGELGSAAHAFIDAVAAMNLAVWQFLPTGPTGYGNSPYQALSTFAGNELLIDTGELVELKLLRADEAAQLQTGGADDRVDFGWLIPRKQALLETAAQRFGSQADSALRTDFAQFVQLHDQRWLHDYALFRLLKTHFGQRAWPSWDAQFAQRDPGALEQVSRTAADALRRIKIQQFLFERQWTRLHRYARSKGVQLLGDLPIYLAHDSADVWAHPELLLTDARGNPERVAGVPPDYFSADGQLWGNPLYDWDYHARHGYAWWVERLRHACTRADLLRIDHFRGFESYWSVPAGAATARDGHWERGPGDALFNALRTGLGELPIIAEDLGIITAEVEALRDRHKLPGMRVLQFDITDPDFSAAQIPVHCVCYTGTHDNDTTRGWFYDDPESGQQLSLRQQQILERIGGTPASVHQHLIQLAFDTRAQLAVVPMQDYLGLGSGARMNRPGTAENNWCWRLTAEQLSADFIGGVATQVQAAGRSRCN